MAYFGAGNQRASPICRSGGLISHGNDEAEYYGLVDGEFPRARIRPTLPVVQSTKVELLLSLKTAKALGLTVLLSMLDRADEVIK
jgi:putative tryptophan/tyrosine transport system substrate-binding protein